MPNFDPDDVYRYPWRDLVVSFNDSHHGHVDFDTPVGDGSGRMGLTRLTMPAALACDELPTHAAR